MNAAAPDAPTRQGVDWLVGRWWFWTLVFVILVGLPLLKSIRRAGALPPVGAAAPTLALVDENNHPWSTAELAGRPFIACSLDEDRGMWRRLGELTARLTHVPADHYHLVAISGVAADATSRVQVAGEFRVAALNRTDLQTARLGIARAADAGLLFDDHGGCTLVDVVGHRRGRYEVSRPEGHDADGGRLPRAARCAMSMSRLFGPMGRVGAPSTLLSMGTAATACSYLQHSHWAFYSLV